jgi:hypothetical protein
MLLKSVLFGLLVAIGGFVAWIVASILIVLQAIAPTGNGGLGAVSGPISSGSSLLVFIACFAVGSTWMYRRLQRRASR